jgi:hypothetical protein
MVAIDYEKKKNKIKHKRSRLSKILYDVTSSSSTSSLGIMGYCMAVDNRKDEKA